MTGTNQLNSTLLSIIEAALDGDKEKAREFASLYINQIENTSFRESIKNLLGEDTKLKPSELKTKKSPSDTESRLPLIDLQLVKNKVPLYLSDNQFDSICEFIELLGHYQQLKKEGIDINCSLVLSGPPGTGKSQTARYIAQKTGRPLGVVNIDALISSYLGSTAKNIEKVFNYAENSPMILFLDEFDAIAKARDDSQEVGEIKRVVNTLLQNIDSLSPDVPVIAATNHSHLLDNAVWRRFSFRVDYQLPQEGQRKKMIKEFSQDMKFDQLKKDVLAELTSGYSGSDIRTFLQSLKARMIINDQEVSLNFVVEEFKRFDSSTSGEASQSEKEYVRELRSRNSDFFSHGVLAKMFNRSKSTINRYIRNKDA